MNERRPPSVVRPVPRHLPAEPTQNMYASVRDPLHNHQQQGNDGGEVVLREYFRVLIKHRILILSAIALSAALSLVFAFTVTPRYTAESKVRISSYDPVLTATRVEDVLQEKSRESTYLETQVQELKSFSLADRVLLDKEISDSFKKENKGLMNFLFGSAQPKSVKLDGTYQHPIPMIRSYLASIEITPVRRTSLVAIGATSEDPEIAADIANRHAREYIDWVRSGRIQQQTQGLTFLKSQEQELRQKTADLEREMADYAEANSIVAVNKDENITAQKMSQINKLLTDSTGKRIEAENAYREANSALANPSAGYDDPSAQSMRMELGKLEGEYQQLSAKFTDSYPQVQQLRSQIVGLKAAIQSQRTQIVSGLKSKMQAAQEEEKKLIEELEQQKSLAFELSKRQVQYNVLNRELTTTRELFESVSKQIKETSLAVESNASNVTIVDEAVIPMTASFPNKKIVLAVGSFLGLLVGLGFAFLLNYLDNTIRTPEDVIEHMKLPSLGVVPSFELPDVAVDPVAAAQRKRGSLSPDLMAPVLANGSQSPVVFLNEPRSLASEAYRTIRTAILLSQAGEPPRRILVTSAQSSEGKTTSSLNLAASLAGSGGSVCIIDADLRRPSIHERLELDSLTPGVVEILTGLETIDGAIRRDVLKRVSVIPAGTIPPNPAELLGSPEMDDLLAELEQRFDYVLIDSPPILPVTDSVILSRLVDGVVLVVRGGSTPAKVVMDAKDRLLNVGARVLGVILNDVNIRSGDYYYYNRYYHSYYRKEKTKGKEERAA